jgi:hypothetical protein
LNHTIQEKNFGLDFISTITKNNLAIINKICYNIHVLRKTKELKSWQ